jgi:hypothetical protein
MAEMERPAGPQRPEHPVPPGAEARWAGLPESLGPANSQEWTPQGRGQRAAERTGEVTVPQPRSSSTEDPSPLGPHPEPSSPCVHSN